MPQLWAKPQVYARFLGAELRFVYKDTLLIVMPQGFGINGPYPLPRALAALSGIDPRKDTTPAGPDRRRPTRRCARWRPPTARRSAAASGGGGGLPLPLIAAAVMVAGRRRRRRADPARQQAAR